MNEILDSFCIGRHESVWVNMSQVCGLVQINQFESNVIKYIVFQFKFFKDFKKIYENENIISIQFED
jgi:hypothetical protein